MTGALFFLFWNSWKNRMLMRIRRLKQPKYLVGLIVGLLYFMYVFGIRFIIGPGRSRTGQAAVTMITPENADRYEALGALILFAVVLLSWVMESSRAALIFSEAEIAFLFPAPVKRKTLIHYKLLKSQILIIFMILLLTVIFARFTAGKIAWIHALGWWVILSILGLHRLGASFVRTRLLDRGISNWKRRIVILTLVAGAVIAVVIWAKNTIPPYQLEDPSGGHAPQLFVFTDSIAHYVREVLQSGPAPYLLYPFRLVVRPYVSLDWPEFFAAFGPALLLLVLHYFWVVRSNVAFEEASIEASRKMAEKVASFRANRGQMVSTPRKKKKAPFELRVGGTPAIAFLWKNLIGAGQVFNVRFWLLMLWISGVSGFAISSGSKGGFDLANFVGVLAMMLLMMSFFIGPQMMRQDFRQDLPMADVMKTYPLRGWQVALGELAAPVVILTGIQWILIVLTTILCSKFGRDEFPLEWRLSLAGSLALLAPALNCVTLIIPNAAVLMFPGWFGTGKDQTQGIEVMGQRIIFAFGQFFVFLGALLPAGVAFLVTFWLAKMFVGAAIAVPIGAVWATVALGAEAWFGLLWLGRLFDKFDLSLEQTN